MEGTPFGRYRLVELLGRGGMGEVWRAHDTVIDRTVAIKTLLPHFAQDKTFEHRFRREARAAARLDDPHVVPIYDVGEIDGRLYVAMRLINGEDLQTLLNRGPLGPDRAVGITEQVASALQAAHEVDLVHRDVKPSNILVTEDDFAYLIDFGIARAAGETGLTSTGATIGTWSYMAPERFSTGDIKPSSDIYALACVLYQSLTGQLPFPGTTLEQPAPLGADCDGAHDHPAPETLCTASRHPRGNGRRGRHRLGQKPRSSVPNSERLGSGGAGRQRHQRIDGNQRYCWLGRLRSARTTKGCASGRARRPVRPGLQRVSSAHRRTAVRQFQSRRGDRKSLVIPATPTDNSTARLHSDR